eukprot:TRINITY_DN7020_c0_g1_i1.p1 TRINITY_DN7020_c0_g1~~TRINITY_DN7020_c0_g1_i1.p1  ORF type:complete len:213 (+),score=33.52 TRINITY_DN7020_c0_g1_i1:63-701(+)
MNVFRFVGDMLHLLSVLLVLLKMQTTRSCRGLSLKSQELYALVFATRYLDLFTTFVSFYNTIMKIIFLGTSFAIVYLVRFRYKATYDHAHDTFRVLVAIIPCLICAMIWNLDFTVMEVLWSFSIFLEAIAMLPQMFMLSRTKEIDIITSHYMTALGGYRLMYIFNWIYRYMNDEHTPTFTWVCGVVQTLLYCDLFYLYFQAWRTGKKMSLPL